MNKVVGTCGACGGSVVVPTVWMGTQPPIPQCNRCHKLVKAQGPVLPMR